MTTRRRAVLTRIGVVAAVAVGTLAVAAPAFAANVGVSVTPPGVFNAGDAQILTIQVENKTKVDGAAIQLSVSGLTNFTLSDPQGCVGSANSCVVTGVDGGGRKTVSFTIKATGSVDPGKQKTDHGTVTATLAGESANDGFDATIRGGQQTQAPSVTQVSGTVRDITSGTAIKGAVVVLVDGGACAPGKEACQTGTDSQGAFRFTSKPDKPITPGSIQVGATKSGYDNGSATVEGRAGQSVTVTVKLRPNASASSSASADPLPALETQAATTDAATQPAGAAAQKPASSSGPSTVSWIILVLAGLLVLLGVGVFVVMFLNRRKGDAENEEGDGNPPTGPPGAPVPPGGGVYGTAPGANPTMVAGMVPGPGMTQTVMATPGAADATAVLRPGRPEDEFPDPYAAPYPASPAGYPPAGSGYGAATQVGGYPPAGPPSGYDPAMQGYGAPAGYDRQGGYGGAPTTPQPPQPQRYDDATRHWDAGAAGGYPGDPGAGGAGHAAQPGGYQGGGYDQPATGYDPRAGYGQPTAGYDPYHQQPNETPSRRGGRRGRDQRLDWLDD